MGDSNEELEPLFDYSRVQPVGVINLDDDSDSSPENSPKRRKTSKTTVNNNNNKEDSNDDKGKSVEVIVSDDEEEKENWLPPPPKNVVPSSKIHEDSTIKELRLKRQQLASVVQSTEHALRAAEEAARRTLAATSNSVTEETAEEVLMPAVNRTKIVVSIQDKAGVKQYRIYADDKFEQLFKNYAQKVNNDVHNLVFSFDGERINPATTPQILGMEDDDLIEANVIGS